jgi:eukaryotic-like serine/threonine-protein kinase
MTPGRIGKFEVLSRISSGGMADVYRCRLKGIGGFEKILAVKRIRAERASDPRFVAMFLDEARLAASLSHPNIVQIFEIGEAGGTPYIAMEYVPGPTLARLLREIRRRHRNHPMQAGPVARVLADICDGLHHAHTARAPGGAPLHLVHRDVSPQNILVSWQGLPKLLDFGVAKAHGRLTETQAGMLKGKLRYMAPEQLLGKVDPRADVFAVGVCLFEATVGRGPFAPDDADEVTLWSNITSGRLTRPSELIADYPPALEEVVLAAIEPDASRRCPSARELHDRLEELVSREPFRCNSRAVADWVTQLVPPDQDSAGPAAAAPRREATTAAERFPPTHSGAGSSVLPVPARPAPAQPPRSTASRRPRALVAAALAAAGALAGMGAVRLSATAPLGQPSRPAPGQLDRNRGIELVQKSSPGPADQPAAAQPAVGDTPETRAGASALRVRRRRTGPKLAQLPPQAETTGSPPGSASAALAHPAARAQGSPGDLVRLPRSPSPPSQEPPPAQVTANPEPIRSQRPLARVPWPRLARVAHPAGPKETETILAAVEAETLKARCSPEYVRGVTGELARELSRRGPPQTIHPSAIYYFIVREAGLGRDKRAAADALAAAHTSGAIEALAGLPIAEGANPR